MPTSIRQRIEDTLIASLKEEFSLPDAAWETVRTQHGTALDRIHNIMLEEIESARSVTGPVVVPEGDAASLLSAAIEKLAFEGNGSPAYNIASLQIEQAFHTVLLVEEIAASAEKLKQL